MPIEVLAGNNQLLAQWVAFTPKFRMTENSSECQLLPPQMCTHLGSPARDPLPHSRNNSPEKLPTQAFHGLWSSSQKYNTENVDITPESSFAHLIQLLLNAHIRPTYTERAELRIGFLRYWLRGFPGSPVGKMPRSQCRGVGFDAWLGN